MNRIGIAVCSLNQLSLDFDGNCKRIIDSIHEAIQLSASIRVGPELEVTGYCCEDAFYEIDTTFHSWQVLAQIIKQDFKNILIDVGMPVLKDSALYNCRILILNSKIILIRPKTRLAMNGNYRETRWFTAWNDNTRDSGGSLTWFYLPPIITKLNNQLRVPFGDKAILEFNNSNSIEAANDMSNTINVRIGYEICEELWHSDAQHINLFGQRGCHIIMNSSASYWEIRKLDHALNLIRTATFKSGGVYAFSNLVGCDGGGRLCFYGRSSIMMNGQLLAMTTSKQTIFNEIQTEVSYIDINDITQYRLQNNIKIKSYKSNGSNLVYNTDSIECYNSVISSIEQIDTINIIGFNIFKASNKCNNPQPITQLYLKPEEEIMIYCSLWLWDYLRRCSHRGIQGFIVPLSGGLDSSSVVCLVYSLCTLLWQHIHYKNIEIINQLKTIFNINNIEEEINSPKLICEKILKCVYLSTRYSGNDSYDRALNLAQTVNCNFVAHNFDDIFKLIQNSVPLDIKSISGEVSLIEQNVQARLRMVLTYYLSEGKRLVLATGNVDEALVGYLTKYDCSSADLNPIGSISKHDLRNFMKFCKTLIPESTLIIDRIIDAIPSAELTGETQSDEQDLGLTYDQLSVFGRLRRGEFGTYGPYGMFCKIWHERHNHLISFAFNDINNDPKELARKVKRFFTLYANNRHKQTVLTPALHSETYSPDDNRFDHRQFLFDSRWKWQFDNIDQYVNQLNSDN